ncbi:family 16 glycosylhydrolase [Leptothoe sp. LEGE 181152]|nr:family 16 glycosylhydrolase [Leptothoe sp. LEGE 181152]
MVNHPSILTNWDLVFEDNFDGSELNQDNWNTTYYYGSRTNTFNDEAQYYVDEALTVANGTLSISANKLDQPLEAFEGVDQYLLAQQGKDLFFDYTSGMISGHDKIAFTYGYMEIKASLPVGQGLWPAFWMLPSTGEWPPEIDIMEFLGHQTDTVYGTLHYQDPDAPNGNAMEGNSVSGIDFSEGEHTFAVKWTPERITWFVDGQKAFTITGNIPQQAMYLLANLAVCGSWPGDPDHTTLFPSSYDIDYIRVYQNKRGILHGGLGDDTLSRTRGDIYGGAGDDVLSLSKIGNLYGEDGNDILNGGERKNVLDGGTGDDQLFGYKGHDELDGGTGNDHLDGGWGHDQLNGEDGDDYLFGDRGRDILNGGAGDDKLDGGWGHDQLNGEDGDDYLFGDRGRDILNGGTGGDELDGGLGQDHLDGGAGNDLLEGNFGHDYLQGGLGNDQLFGDKGRDSLIGVDINASTRTALVGINEIDILTGGEGADIFYLGDTTSAFYDDGDNLSLGEYDYALISDFNYKQNDLIQLHGSLDDYLLEATAEDLEQGIGIYLKTAGQNELIGIVENVTDLNLSNQFFKIADSVAV